MTEAARSSGAAADPAAGHGWWPYLLPYLAFLAAVELGNRLPEAAALPMLAVKPALPLVLIAYFAVQGRYPELRGLPGRPGWIAADLLVGVATAVLWMAPFVLLPALRPADASGFDPRAFGALAPLAVGLRMFGYAVVTPLFEELFIRSFIMRISEVWNQPRDFRSVPIAHFSWRSFWVTVLVFTVGHVPWEWWVAVPWIALTNLWFYYRGRLGSVILVHGAANASILLAAMLASGRFDDGQGGPLSLWFFV